LIYTTHLNNIYFKNLSNNTSETLYQNSQTKALISDHYISQLYYFKDCDKIFAVSQMRPDVLQQESQGSSSREFAYPFHLLHKQAEVEEQEEIKDGRQSYFGNKNLSSVPKTLGNVFSNEWRDLLKFIAVSKGNTNMPQGLDQINTRP
jgi:hypothetical protein